jgi:hypothetical protein
LVGYNLILVGENEGFDLLEKLLLLLMLAGNLNLFSRLIGMRTNRFLKKIALLLFCLIIIPGYSQKNLSIGLESGLTKDKYELFDKGGYLKNPEFLLSVYWGFNVRYQFHPFVSFETGILKKNYNEGFGTNLSSPILQVSSNAIESWQIPFRFNTRIPFCGNRINLIATIGYRYGINTEFNSSGSGSGTFIGTMADTLRYTDQSSYNLSRQFSLIETGLGIEFRLFHKAYLTLSTSYITGFNKLIQNDITYSINQGASHQAMLISRGQYRSVFNFAIRVPILRLARPGINEIPDY